MSSIIDVCGELETAAAANALQVRSLTAGDVATASTWLNRRMKTKAPNAADFPRELLPVTGLAAWQNDKLLAVATLYLERSSPVAVCGWCIADPDNPPGISYRAINTIMLGMPQYAQKHGAKYLLTTFGNRGINAILDNIGFQTAEYSENKLLII